jgi:hypothetical protein
MKRSAVGLTEIANWHNLAAAFHAATRGKRGRGDVEAFRRNLDDELSDLGGIARRLARLDGCGAFRSAIPNRTIHAPCASAAASCDRPVGPVLTGLWS